MILTGPDCRDACSSILVIKIMKGFFFGGKWNKILAIFPIIVHGYLQ